MKKRKKALILKRTRRKKNRSRLAGEKQAGRWVAGGR